MIDETARTPFGAEIDRLAGWMAAAGRGPLDVVPSWISDEAWRWVQNHRRAFGAAITNAHDRGAA